MCPFCRKPFREDQVVIKELKAPEAPVNLSPQDAFALDAENRNSSSVAVGPKNPQDDVIKMDAVARNPQSMIGGNDAQAAPPSTEMVDISAALGLNNN